MPNVLGKNFSGMRSAWQLASTMYCTRREVSSPVMSKSEVYVRQGNKMINGKDTFLNNNTSVLGHHTG